MSLLLSAYRDLQVRVDEGERARLHDNVEALRDAMDELWLAMTDAEHAQLDVECGQPDADPSRAEGPHR